MEIQRLFPEDWMRLRELRLAALSDAPDAFGSTLEDAYARSAEDWRRQLETLTTFVAMINGQDMGLARGAPDDADPANAYLLSMWIAPDARGQGGGEGLVRAVADWAQTAGFSRLVLDVADDNAPAIALYARLGFQPTGDTGSLPPPRTHVREHRRALNLPV